MSMRNLTRKLFGLIKTKKKSPERQPSSHLSMSRSRSTTPLRADDDKSPLWPRFYNRLVRKLNPNMSEEDVKYYTDKRVQWRKQDREKKRARENATRRPPSLQNVGLYMPIQANKSRSRSKTPLRADDNNSPLWPRFYNRLVRKQNPNMSDEDVKYYANLRVEWRKKDREKNRAREKARQNTTMRRGGKKSRRKSRSLLSILN